MVDNLDIETARELGTLTEAVSNTRKDIGEVKKTLGQINHRLWDLNCSENERIIYKHEEDYQDRRRIKLSVYISLCLSFVASFLALK